MSSDAFWRWSIAVYARPGVPEACLGLQDRLGLDVNLLLLAHWLAGRGLALGDSAADVLAFAGPWQRDVVQPLRAARRALKAGAYAAEPAARALREAVKHVELEAERLEQQELANLSAAARPATLPEAALVAGNLRALGIHAGGDPDGFRRLRLALAGDGLAK